MVATAKTEPLVADELRTCLTQLHGLATGLSTVECNHLCRAVERLANGPAGTSELQRLLGFDSVGATTRILGHGRRLGIVLSKRRYGAATAPNGRAMPGQDEAEWSIDNDGLRTIFARLEKKPTQSWPLDVLPAKQREYIESIDFAREGLSETEAWWVANIIAMIFLAGGRLKVRRDEMGSDFGLKPATLRPHRTLAEKKGFIAVESPARKGSPRRPTNTYTVIDTKLRSLQSRGPQRPLAQGRAHTPIGGLWPAVERWAPEQKSVVESIDRMLVGLSDSEVKRLLRVPVRYKFRRSVWDNLLPVLAMVGDGGRFKLPALCGELGCTEQPLEKVVRKARAAGLLEPARGPNSKGTLIEPRWTKLQLIAGDVPKPKSKRRTKAPTNGQADAVETASPPPVTKPKWDAEAGVLSFGAESRDYARQAANARRVLTAFHESEWNDWVLNPFKDPQTHHNAIRILNSKQSFIRFSSSRSGTAISWTKFEN